MTFARFVLIPTTLLILGLFSAVLFGVRLNVTASVPTGLYLQSPPKNLDRGRLVVACLDPDNRAAADAIQRGYLPAGNCPGDVAPVIKPIAAIGGDYVSTSPSGITVNGRPIPRTAHRGHDPQGRPLAHPQADYIVPLGSVLLLVEKTSSFDGRYFGVLPVANVRAEAAPLLLF